MVVDASVCSPRHGCVGASDGRPTAARNQGSCPFVPTGPWLTFTITRPRFHARPARRGEGDVRAGEFSASAAAPKKGPALGGPPLLVGGATDWLALVAATVVVHAPGVLAAQPGEEFPTVFRGVDPHRTMP